jgi:hypothetical protein
MNEAVRRDSSKMPGGQRDRGRGLRALFGLGPGVVTNVGFTFSFTDYVEWQVSVPAGSGPTTAPPGNNQSSPPAAIIFTLDTDTWNFAFGAWVPGGIR